MKRVHLLFIVIIFPLQAKCDSSASFDFEHQFGSFLDWANREFGKSDKIWEPTFKRLRFMASLFDKSETFFKKLDPIVRQQLLSWFSEMVDECALLIYKARLKQSLTSDEKKALSDFYKRPLKRLKQIDEHLKKLDPILEQENLNNCCSGNEQRVLAQEFDDINQFAGGLKQSSTEARESLNKLLADKKNNENNRFWTSTGLSLLSGTYLGYTIGGPIGAIFGAAAGGGMAYYWQQAVKDPSLEWMNTMRESFDHDETKSWDDSKDDLVKKLEFINKFLEKMNSADHISYADLVKYYSSMSGGGNNRDDD